MEVSRNVLSNVNFGYKTGNTLLQKKKPVTDKITLNKDETDGESLSLKLKNFEEISKLFPDISFIVVADYGEIKTEYSGISNTSAFSYKNKVSIALHEDVVGNWDKDRENIIESIKGIKNEWSIIANNLEMPDNKTGKNCEYTFANLHYKQASKELSYSQCFASSQCFADFVSGPYNNDKQPNKDRYFKNILLNKQNEMYDILFKVGRKKGSYAKHKSYIEKYKEQTFYMNHCIFH